MIRKDLLDFQYYLNRLSKFMQESYGINEQTEMFYSFLKQVNDVYDDMLKDLNIFSSNEDEVKGEILDKIGAIFNCQRRFTIPLYENNEDPMEITGYANINLADDKDYLTYIKTQIVKQNFKGTREELQKLYTTYVNNILKEDSILDLQFIYITNPTNMATCDIYWNEANPSEQLKLLFDNGYLTIESLGIRYSRNTLVINDLGFYYVDGAEEKSYNKFAIEKYLHLDSEPEDWATAENKYFIITNAEDVPVDSQTGDPEPWDNDNIYATVDDNDYIYQPYQPIRWKYNYTGYKILTLRPKTSEDIFSSSNSYEYNVIGGLFA